MYWIFSMMTSRCIGNNFEKQFSKYYDGVREGVQGPATLLSAEFCCAKYLLDLNQINPDY